MIRALEGLARLLRRPAPVVGQTPADVIHHENKWRLLRYRPAPEGPRWRTPVLIVPSLINRHYVLDLTPGKSFVEAMVARGHDVYLLDWGTPGPEDRYLDFDEICDRYIGRAIRRTARQAGAAKVHVLGYCLGGTLAAIHTAVRPRRVASLVTLAAPIDFVQAGIMYDWASARRFDVGALVDAMGNVPWPLMQGAFQLLRPTLPLVKAVGLVERVWDDEFLDGFFALERWGSDGVSFPGACYRRYIQALYRDNALVHGRFTLSGEPVHLERITCPTLVVTFAGDHIVPEPSSRVLVDRIGAADKQALSLRGGHVGSVVSRKAAVELWPRLSAWWSDHELRAVSAA
ncbi:MAG: alpha/beta fold hydrolase [Myxococcales bacterium]|nr:alpha/beta fold hydrolase [Myxococcales bacterium]